MIGLGARARDTITGLTGTVISRHEYLNGCVRLALQPMEVKDGKPVEPSVFDIEQLELVTEAPARETKPTGGPHDEPGRPDIPSR